MTSTIMHALRVAAIAATACVAASTLVMAGPTGVWIDHTGRGAVEIRTCGGALCGRVVWLKNAAHAKACGMQILGNVKPVAGGKWDKGWIYDPNRRAKFAVELTPHGSTMQVMGYVNGNKSLNKLMTWTRAPGKLERCKA
jgi:uncharacterized protein (DUF2147 family)